MRPSGASADPPRRELAPGAVEVFYHPRPPVHFPD